MIGVTRKQQIALYFPLILLGIFSLLPFLIMVANAGKTDLEIATSLSLLPSGNFLENLNTATSLAPLYRGVLNSLFVATSATVLNIYFSTMVAYGFSVYKFKHNRKLFLFVLLTMMIPGQLTFIGFYDMVKGLGLMNSYIPLIIPGIASAGNVYFLKQYCDQIVSLDTIESARIDGASEMRIFHRCILPILTPAMSTMAIFTFIGNWNNYLVPLLIINDSNKYTLPVMLRYIAGMSSISSVSIANAQGAIYASALVSIVPVLIIFVVFSKRIVGGLNAGSVKG